jgi:Na+-translocating ferredoxin:NAD+ oxidoreductase subunit B
MYQRYRLVRLAQYQGCARAYVLSSDAKRRTLASLSLSRHTATFDMTLFYAAAALAGLAAGLATLLLFASRRLAIDEDPRLAAIQAALPGINCGACGRPSCQAFADALIAGTVTPAACSVSSPAVRSRIARFLGVPEGEARRRVARLACAGDRRRAPFQAQYRGEPSCAAAAQVAGGGKACAWGCLNLGDCVHACTFDAIRLTEHALPEVDESRCTACGDCVSACPKDLFRLEPADNPIWVACVNPGEGNALVDVCSVACTACGKCAFDAPGWIRMDGNLPVVRVNAAADAGGGRPPRASIDRCPTGAIVWVEAGRRQLGAVAQGG